MATSERATIAKWRKWKAGNPDWPLTVAPNGQWQKKIRGRVHYFGVLDDKDAAIALWRHEKVYLLAGEEPPKQAGGMTVGDLCDKFATDVRARKQVKEIGQSYGTALLGAVRFLRRHLPASRSVKSLAPEHFTALRSAVMGTGRTMLSQGDLIQYVRSIFLWGQDMGYCEAVKFGPRFKRPSADVIAREREASDKNRFVDREDILALLGKAKPAMKCMILLGVNCGFYASDSVHLTFSRLHLDCDTPYHDFARMKNGRRRMATLWPETIKALNAYIDRHRQECQDNRVLLTVYGRPFGERAGRGLDIAFKKLAKEARVALPPGTSIGSLRHTYGTVVDLAADQQMIDLSMGHSPRSLQKRIYSQLNLGELDRLAAVAEIVRRWLYFGEIAGLRGDGKGEGDGGRLAGRFRVVG